MPKHRHPEEHHRREPSLRRVRQPWHLQELEVAAQTDVDATTEEAGQPLEDQAQRGIAFDPTRDSEQVRVDTGLSVDPEDLGLQFLRDATVQDNFESEFQAEAPTMPDSPQLGDLIPEDTLLAEGLEEGETFLVTDSTDERPSFVADVDLLSNVIYEASLFDEPTEQDETVTPRIESDESAPSPSDTDAREREQERERRALRRLRFARPGVRSRPSRR